MAVNQSKWWDGLHEDWERDYIIRQRMKDKQHLVASDPDTYDPKDPRNEYVEKTMGNLRYNVEVLIPALERWAANDPAQVPQVDCLFAEIQTFYRNWNREYVGAGYIHLDAWALRRLMTLLKSLTTKASVPKEALLECVFVLFACTHLLQRKGFHIRMLRSCGCWAPSVTKWRSIRRPTTSHHNL